MRHKTFGHAWENKLVSWLQSNIYSSRRMIGMRVRKKAIWQNRWWANIFESVGPLFWQFGCLSPFADARNLNWPRLPAASCRVQVAHFTFVECVTFLPAFFNICFVNWTQAEPGRNPRSRFSFFFCFLWHSTGPSSLAAAISAGIQRAFSCRLAWSRGLCLTRSLLPAIT